MNSRIQTSWSAAEHDTSSNETTTAAFSCRFQTLNPLRKITEPTESCHLFLLRLEIHFALSETKMCDGSVFAMIRVTGTAQPQCTGHLKQKKKMFRNPIPVECRADLNQISRVSLKSGLLSSCIVERKRGMGERCGCCTAVHLHGLYLGWGGHSTDALIMRMGNLCDVMQGSLWRETEKIKWVFHCCVPAYYFVLFPKENDFTAIARYLLWIPKIRETVLLAYYRLREHWDSTGERGEPLNNCTNTGCSPVWCAWLKMSACWEMLCLRLWYDLSTLGTT